LRETDAARVDHREFEQAARGKRFDMDKAGDGIGDGTAGIGAGRQERRVRRINRNVHFRSNALDYPRINLPVEGYDPPLS
jgi:hypothetical protein